MKKTNVLRILDKEKIAYNAGEYAYDENDLNGLHAARELGLTSMTRRDIRFAKKEQLIAAIRAFRDQGK